MVDFNQKNSIDDIKKEKFGEKDVESADKDYFFSHDLVKGEIAKAREVAILLDKVMRAEGKAEKDEFDGKLLKELIEEENKKSLAFQVLDSRIRGKGTVGYVKNAIYALSALKSGKGEETLLFEIEREIDSLRNALQGEKQDLADLKKISDDFESIKKKIEEAQGKIGSNSILLEPKRKELARLKNERENLKLKRNEANFLAEKQKYDNYLAMVKQKLDDLRSDNVVNRGNKFDVNISRVRKGSVTGTQLLNSLYFFLKEVIEKIDDIDALENWTGKNLKTDYDEVKRGIEMLGDIKDTDKYAERGSDGDILRKSNDDIEFKYREGPERKMWEPRITIVEKG